MEASMSSSAPTGDSVVKTGHPPTHRRPPSLSSLLLDKAARKKGWKLSGEARAGARFLARMGPRQFEEDIVGEVCQGEIDGQLVLHTLFLSFSSLEEFHRLTGIQLVFGSLGFVAISLLDVAINMRACELARLATQVSAQ